MAEPPPLARTVTDLVPQGLVDRVRAHVPATGYGSGEDWLATLPRLVRELTEQWDLELTGPATHGYAALVLPVEHAEGPAVLKVAWPHPEARDEHRTLAVWGGRGAVRLRAADPSRWALLLERLDPRDLRSPVGILESCTVVGQLAALLDRPAPPWTTLRASEHLATLVTDLEALRLGEHAGSLPRRLLKRGRSLAADLSTEPGVDARLVHGDLHQENVLWRSDPGEWVAIDPQTIAADPAWVVAPALWNRWPEAAAAHDIRTHLTLRLEVLCDAAGLDPARARAFTEVRMLRNAVWDIQEGTASPESLTRHVTLIKAFQPA